MSFEAKVLADSVSPAGHRLTTMEATFPRFVLAEFNTPAAGRRGRARGGLLARGTGKDLESVAALGASYLIHAGTRDLSADVALYDRLGGPIEEIEVGADETVTA